MINLYIGHDPRESVGTHVFLSSLLKQTTAPVAVTFLHKPMLHRLFGGDIAEGTNAFTLSRFLIPFIQNWRGDAIYMDGADMLLKADLGQLEVWRDPYKAVQVVKHEYQTNDPLKYRGTSMEAENTDYGRKNWASMMLISCHHYAWRKMTPQYLRSASKVEILNFSWMEDGYIGEIPKTWNWLADEYGFNADAKLLHWTQGIPGFNHYKYAPHGDDWHKALEDVNYSTN